MSKLILPNLSYLICGLLFKAHRELSWSHPEKVYQREISKALTRESLRFVEQHPVRLMTEDRVDGKYFLDFVVEDLIVLEIKASRQFFSSRFLDQVLAYLSISNFPLGLVINFRVTRLKPVRVLNPNFRDADYTIADARFTDSGASFVKIRQD